VQQDAPTQDQELYGAEKCKISILSWRNVVHEDHFSMLRHCYSPVTATSAMLLREVGSMLLWKVYNYVNGVIILKIIYETIF
jgi:hypothetical protein